MHARNNSISVKLVVLLLAVVLTFGCAVGGTLAWLTDTTKEVNNTFTVGNIWIDLYEHTRDADGTLTTTEVKALSDYKIIPGTNEAKDPTVKVLANSENCWVFIQVQEVNNVVATDTNGATTHKYVTWEIDDDVWTELSENNGVVTYYASYTTQNTDKIYNVLSDSKVSYGDSLTKEMIDELYTTDSNGNATTTVDAKKQPRLNFKAFAVQAGAGTAAADAWAQIPNTEYLGYVAPTN